MVPFPHKLDDRERGDDKQHRTQQDNDLSSRE
jgi:hypothetical protein